VTWMKQHLRITDMAEAKKDNRLLKLNKKFEPLPSEEDEEFFPNGIFLFNITKLLAFAESNSEKVSGSGSRSKVVTRFRV
jgi:hypothetical protein